MSDHKYSVDDDHWEEDDQDAVDDPRPRVEVNSHSVTIDRLVEDRYVDRYRYRFAVEGQAVVGWSRTDIEHTGTEDYNPIEDWDAIPTTVRNALARELGVDSHRALDLDVPAYMRGEDDE